jgi:hypothetical protein
MDININTLKVMSEIFTKPIFLDKNSYINGYDHALYYGDIDKIEDCYILIHKSQLISKEE